MDFELREIKVVDTQQIALQLKALFSSQGLAVVSTHEHGQPYCNLVAFASSEDLKQLVFATTRSTRKYANIDEDHRISCTSITGATGCLISRGHGGNGHRPCRGSHGSSKGLPAQSLSRQAPSSGGFCHVTHLCAHAGAGDQVLCSEPVPARICAQYE